MEIKKMGGWRIWLISFSIPLLLTVLLNLICFPILNSGDDAFLMYTVAGGYGEAPTNMLHFNYGWHYWLGTVVSFLFGKFPAINWYSLTLLTVHICGLSLLLYVLLKRHRPGMAFFLFAILYLFFETRFLLAPNFSNTAIIGSMGSLVLFLHLFQKREKNISATVFGILLLIISAFLRLHMVLIVFALFLPIVFFILPVKNALKWMAVTAVTVILFFGLYKLHENAYINKNPQWEKQEAFRQALNFSFNRPVKDDKEFTVFKDSLEREKYFAFYFYDTVLFSRERVKEISHVLVRRRTFSKADTEGLYWLFIDLRIYIVLFGLFFGYAILNKQMTILWKWVPALGIYLILHAYLFVFLKSTWNIHIGSLLFLWVIFCLVYEPGSGRISFKRKLDVLFLAGILVLVAWMGWRLYKQDQVNRENYKRLRCILSEVHAQQGKLFVVFGDIFPLSHFYIWDNPGEYPLPNLLYKDRMLSFTYPHTLKRFGIENLDSAILNDRRILFIGKPTSDISIARKLKEAGNWCGGFELREVLHP